MRILRCTMIAPGGLDKVTTVMRESDLKASIENCIKEITTFEQGKRISLVVTEVWTMDDNTTIEAATLEGKRRMDERAEEEDSMGCFFYWNGEQLKRVTPYGVLANPAPAPLRADDLEYCLKRCAALPWYQHQKMICFSGPDNKALTMQDGEVTIA